MIGVLVATRFSSDLEEESSGHGDKREPDSGFYKNQGFPRCKEYISRDLGEILNCFFHGFVRSSVEIFQKKRGGNTVRGSFLIVFSIFFTRWCW